MRSKPVDKNALFDMLCKNDIYCTSGVTCLPSTYLAKTFNTSRYQVKKALKELIAEQLVVSTTDYYYSDYHARGSVLRGYCVSKYAHSTLTYKLILDEYVEYCRKLCNGEIRYESTE